MPLVCDNKGKLTCCDKRMVITRTGAVCTVCETTYTREILNAVARQRIIEQQIAHEMAKDEQQ